MNCAFSCSNIRRIWIGRCPIGKVERGAIRPAESIAARGRRQPDVGLVEVGIHSAVVVRVSGQIWSSLKREARTVDKVVLVNAVNRSKVGAEGNTCLLCFRTVEGARDDL